jgi:peptide chain release factor 2
MVEDRSQDIAAMSARVVRIGEYLHLDAKRADVAALEEKAGEPGFWDDPNAAQAVMSKAAGLRDEIESYESIAADLEEAEVGNELALADDSAEMAADRDAMLKDLGTRVNDLELSSWFTGEFDHGDAIVTRRPRGAGLGRDASPHVHQVRRAQEVEARPQ